MAALVLCLMDKYWSRLNPDSSESELINNNRFRGKHPIFLLAPTSSPLQVHIYTNDTTFTSQGCGSHWEWYFVSDCPLIILKDPHSSLGDFCSWLWWSTWDSSLGHTSNTQLQIQYVKRTNQFEVEFLSFRSVLRSTTMVPVYSPSIDTVIELLDSDMDLAVPSGTAVASLLEDDPRTYIRHLYKRRVVLYPYIFGNTPDWVWEG